MKKITLILILFLSPIILLSQQLSIKDIKNNKTIINESYRLIKNDSAYVIVTKDKYPFIETIYIFDDNNNDISYNLAIIKLYKYATPDYINFFDKNLKIIGNLIWYSLKDDTTYNITMPDEDKYSYILVIPNN